MSEQIDRSLGRTPFASLPFGGINANVLRLIAILCMISDHLWATVIPGNSWMTYVGRVAFPIFAFQVTEGFFHTRNLKTYKKRLFFFALLSEIPYNLIMGGSIIDPFSQNVMFTLLLGLLGIEALERAGTRGTAGAWIRGILTALLLIAAGTVGFVDFGWLGVVTVYIFYVFRGFRFAWLGQLAAMLLFHLILFEGMTVPLELFGHSWELTTQGFAVLALLPIWLYNGKKGSSHPVIQYGSYLFYPVHFLILYAAQQIIILLTA